MVYYSITLAQTYAVFLGFLLDDGLKPSLLKQNLAFLSKVHEDVQVQEYRMGEGKKSFYCGKMGEDRD